ncbi:MAG: EamA family transporter [Casimicrobiaceae bacterium]
MRLPDRALTNTSVKVMWLTTALVIVAAISLEVLGQLSFKQGTSSVSQESATQNAGEYLLRVVGDPWVRIGILAYLVEMLFAVAALSLAPLSVVFPLLSLSYCGVAVASSLFLGEKLERRTQVGIVLITLGAAMVAWSSAH